MQSQTSADSDSNPSSKNRWIKALTCAFILLYLYVEAVALLPDNSFRKQIIAPVWNAIEYIGLWQRYVVFAPPRPYNIYLEAIVELEDGQTVIWKYPRLEQMSFLEKMPKIYFRKFFNEFAQADYNSVLWKDLAQYAANSVFLSSGKVPQSVTLVRYRADIVPPTGDPLPPIPVSYKPDSFFKLIINREDLH